jgi:hypothetical protein
MHLRSLVAFAPFALHLRFICAICALYYDPLFLDVDVQAKGQQNIVQELEQWMLHPVIHTATIVPLDLFALL